MDRNDLVRILERFGFERRERAKWTYWLSEPVLDRVADPEAWLPQQVRRLEEQGGSRGQRYRGLTPDEGTEWFLKQFHRGGVLAGEDDVYYPSPDRFLEACVGALRAREAGVASPEPLGVIARRDASGYAGFYLARRRSLRPFSNIARNRPERLADAGGVLARLHANGIDHGDFQLKNLHYDEKDRLNVVDFDPVTFKVPSTWIREWRLHRFRRSLRKYGFHPDDERTFERGYEQRAGGGVRHRWLGRVQGPFLALKNTVSDCRYWWSGRDFEPIEAENVLIRAPNWVGDAVMSLPLIQTLRASYGQASVDVVCRPVVRAVYGHHPDVDTVHELPPDKAWTFPDEVIDERYTTLVVIPKSFRTGLQAARSGIPRRVGFASQGRSLFLTDRVPLAGKDRTVHHAKLYLNLLVPLGIHSEEPPSPRLRIPKPLRRRADELTGSEDYVALHPGSAYGPAKRWPSERYGALADRLVRDYGLDVVVLGVADERDLAGTVLEALPDEKSVNLAGATDLEEAMAVLEGARVVVANDSGLMHLAGALGVPTLGLFGSSDPGLSRPGGERTDVVYRNVSCSPCFERRCPLDEDRYHCLTRIDVEDVLDRLRPWIEAGPTVNSENVAP